MLLPVYLLLGLIITAQCKTVNFVAGGGATVNLLASLDSVPVAGDTILIGDVSGTSTIVLQSGETLNVAEVIMVATSATVKTLKISGSLTTTGAGVTIAANGILELAAGGTITGPVNIGIAAKLQVTGGTFSTSAVNILSGGQLTAANSLALSTSTITLAAGATGSVAKSTTTTSSGASQMNVMGSLTLSTEPNVVFTSFAILLSSGSGGSVTVDGQGTLALTASGSSFNAGSTLTIASGTTLRFAPTTIAGATPFVQFYTGATVVNNGIVVLASGAFNVASTSLSIGGNVQLAGANVVGQVAQATLSLPGSVMVASVLQGVIGTVISSDGAGVAPSGLMWYTSNGGSIRFAGTFEVSGGGTISGTGQVLVTGTLRVSGSAALEVQSALTQTAGTIDIQGGAVMRLRADAQGSVASPGQISIGTSGFLVLDSKYVLTLGNGVAVNSGGTLGVIGQSALFLNGITSIGGAISLDGGELRGTSVTQLTASGSLFVAGNSALRSLQTTVTSEFSASPSATLNLIDTARLAIAAGATAAVSTGSIIGSTGNFVTLNGALATFGSGTFTFGAPLQLAATGGIQVASGSTLALSGQSSQVPGGIVNIALGGRILRTDATTGLRLASVTTGLSAGANDIVLKNSLGQAAVVGTMFVCSSVGPQCVALSCDLSTIPAGATAQCKTGTALAVASGSIALRVNSAAGAIVDFVQWTSSAAAAPSNQYLALEASFAGAWNNPTAFVAGTGKLTNNAADSSTSFGVYHWSADSIDFFTTGGVKTTSQSLIVPPSATYTISTATVINGARVSVSAGGALTIIGSATATRVEITPGATLTVQGGGISAGSASLGGDYRVLATNANPAVLHVSGVVDLSGKLTLIIGSSFDFREGTRVVVLTYANRTGAFAELSVVAQTTRSGLRTVNTNQATVQCGATDCAVIGKRDAGGSSGVASPDNLALGLGIGLGVGIPVLILICVLVYCCCRRAGKQAYETNQPAPRQRDVESQRLTSSTSNMVASRSYGRSGYTRTYGGYTSGYGYESSQ